MLRILEIEIRLCKRSILAGGVWNGFLLGQARGEIVPCRFCGGFDGDGHLFLGVHSPLSVSNSCKS